MTNNVVVQIPCLNEESTIGDVVRGFKKKLPKAKGFSSIMYPGERKNKIYKKNINKDISIPSKILKEMEDLDANE